MKESKNRFTNRSKRHWHSLYCKVLAIILSAFLICLYIDSGNTSNIKMFYWNYYDVCKVCKVHVLNIQSLNVSIPIGSVCNIQIVLEYLHTLYLHLLYYFISTFLISVIRQRTVVFAVCLFYSIFQVVR